MPKGSVSDSKVKWGTSIRKEAIPSKRLWLFAHSLSAWTWGSRVSTLSRSIFLLVTLLLPLGAQLSQLFLYGHPLDFLLWLTSAYSVFSSGFLCLEFPFSYLTAIPRKPFQTQTSYCHASFPEPPFPSLHSQGYGDGCGGWSIRIWSLTPWLPDSSSVFPHPAILAPCWSLKNLWVWLPFPQFTAR